MKSLSCPDLKPEVASKFSRLAKMMALAKDDWFVIGGAALVLWDVPGVEVRDIDVVLSMRDAKALTDAEGVAIGPATESELFRSRIYTQIGTGIQFDLMAEFDVKTPNGWVRVPPKPEFKMAFGAHDILLPSTMELARILSLFGRPKDLARLEILRGQVAQRH